MNNEIFFFLSFFQQESQISMTSPSSTMSPTGLCLRGGPGGFNPHYLYGRPLNMVTGGQGSGQLNMTGRLTGSEISSSCPSSTVKTNLPLPIHSDETITGTETGAETSEESHNGLPLLGMFLSLNTSPEIRDPSLVHSRDVI